MNNENTWDLEHLLDNKSYDFYLKKYLNKQKKLISFYNSDLFQNIENFHKFHETKIEFAIISNKLHNYLSNNINCDLANTLFSDRYQKLSHLNIELEKASSSFCYQVLKQKNNIYSFLAKKEYKYLTRYYDLIFKFKPHILDKNIESFKAQFTPLNNSYYKLFNLLYYKELNVEDVVDSKNKIYKIHNYTAYVNLLTKTDAVLRKNAYTAYNKALNSKTETLATLLYYNYLEKNLDYKSHNFKSYINGVNFFDEVPNTFIPFVYKQVKKFNLLAAEYLEIKHKIIQKKYNIKNLEPWDYNLFISDENKFYSIKEAKKMAIDSLSILGTEYVKLINRAFEKNWIDWYPKINKIGGAYSIGNTYGVSKKYILLNYNKKLGDIFTLVHELGHSIHAEYYSKYQPAIYSDVEIFFAEIPSILNEILLSLHLLDKYKKDPKKRLTILDELISNFVNTTTMQIIFSNFENSANKLINNGDPFNANVAAEIYKQHYAEYLTFNDPKLYEQKNYYSILTVPHFYSSIFYVYKYSIGQICALCIAEAIYKKDVNMVAKYYEFLKSGISLSSFDTIKILNIDLQNIQPWNKCKKILESWLKEYSELTQEIYNV